MTSNKVVLPAPLGPMNPRISAWRTLNDTSFSALTPPKRFDTSLTSSVVFRCPSLEVGAAVAPPPFGAGREDVAPAAPSRNTDRSTSGRSSNSAVGPWNRISPFSMKYASSASVSARFTDCSTRMMVMPCSRIAFTMSSSWAMTVGARPSESSSIISSRGRPMNAMPSVSICCWPPDRFPAGSWSRSRNTGK